MTQYEMALSCDHSRLHLNENSLYIGEGNGWKHRSFGCTAGDCWGFEHLQDAFSAGAHLVARLRLEVLLINISLSNELHQLHDAVSIS